MTLISIERFYQNTSGVKIKAGIYEDTDPRLKGLGKYLLINEIATVVESEPVIVELEVREDAPPIVVPEYERVALDIQTAIVSPSQTITFTAHAMTILNENDIDPDNTLEYFEKLNITRVSKSDASDYVESLD